MTVVVVALVLNMEKFLYKVQKSVVLILDFLMTFTAVLSKEIAEKKFGSRQFPKNEMKCQKQTELTKLKKLNLKGLIGRKQPVCTN